MPLPTAKTPPKRSLSDVSILLYGPSKIGKSTFASQAPDAIFLATEPGLNALDHSKIVWDGRNHIGRMDQDAESCFRVIEQRLAMVSSEIDDEEFDAAESAAWD